MRSTILPGALDLTSGALLHSLGPRKTNALFRDLLDRIDVNYPAERYTQLYVVVDDDTIQGQGCGAMAG
jgi:hypothetical protein